MELQEKKEEKEEIRKLIRKNPKINVPINSRLKTIKIKGQRKHSAGKEFQSTAVRRNRKLLT